MHIQIYVINICNKEKTDVVICNDANHLMYLQVKK